MANIAILLAVLMYIYSIIGVALFSEIAPFAFADLGKGAFLIQRHLLIVQAMFTLFITFTQIGWAEILDQLEVSFCHLRNLYEDQRSLPRGKYLLY